MLTVKGVYENGKVRLLQDVGDIKKAHVYVILVPYDEDSRGDEGVRGSRIIQQVTPIKIKGEPLSETIVKERYLS